VPALFPRLTGRQFASLILGLLLIAALAILIVEPYRAKPATVPDPLPSSAAPKTYDAALKRLDDGLDAARDQLRIQGDEWLVQERVANAALARARLTGSFDDYAAAQSALDSAFATAPAGAGPHLTQASLAFSLHRLARTAAMLDAIDRYAVPAEAETRSEVEAFRGDVAFYRGDYAEALRRYTARDDAFRLAVYQGKTGDPDAAQRALDRLVKGLRFPSAQFLAQLQLQRGGLELQGGAWDKAQAHFTKADAVFPGWWLVQAHVAQMLALSGRRPEAIQQYQGIAERSGAPEVMDALAAVYRAQGDAANSRLWADRAAAVWARRLEQLPEAAWGHAVEHELAFGDPKRALALARKDYAARPHGGSAIALGWALIANNQPAEALSVIKPVLSSAWVSPEQHLVASQAYLLLGQAEAADAEQQKALKLNPRATDPAASLIWFGH
jgi:tetratricopeptide (TPR) repeat protein